MVLIKIPHVEFLGGFPHGRLAVGKAPLLKSFRVLEKWCLDRADRELIEKRGKKGGENAGLTQS